MYSVEIHNRNGGGHYHYHKYFDDEDYGGRMEYVEENIKAFLNYGYKLEDIYSCCEINNAFTGITFFKNVTDGTETADILMRKIETGKEYCWEC